MKALVTTVPFGAEDQTPLKILEKGGVEYLVNPLNKKLTEEELMELVSDVDIIIAGTEPITRNVLARANKLKLISRVGIGLDSVDLLEARKRNVKVCYTPDAPAPAVAELTIGLMISLLRRVQISNLRMHRQQWHRYFGRRLSECTVGVIGAGRIGVGVIKHLSGFGCKILVNDIAPENSACESDAIEWQDKESIYRQADIITFHLPLTQDTKHLVTKKELEMMRHDAVVINTSRGGIIVESDLFDVMSSGHINGAAIDVFEQEPYTGPLSKLENCLLTAHMGSMSVDCRARMEIEATQEAVRFFSGEPLIREVPEEEYIVQEKSL